jgi:hypothetical protein
LNRPSGLAFDSAGNLYVANSGASTIEKFTTNGVGSVFASSGLNYPVGLAFDSAGNLYVANNSGYTIEKFTTNGVGSLFASTGSGSPYALAFDSAGNLYMDQNYGRIDKFTTNGVSSFFANAGSIGPLGLAFDGTGNLYVATPNGLINKITPGGDVIGFASGGLSGPVGLAFDSGGKLHVSDKAGIKEFAPDGTYVGGFSTGQNGAGMIAIRVANPPLIAVCSSNITVTATDSSGATMFYTSSIRGGCSGASISCSPPSGSTFPIGTTTVSCLATDACGQTTSCAFTVTVVKSPLIAVCSSNITVTPTGPSGAAVFYTSSTSGGCSGASISCSPPSGPTFPIGTTTVSCLATDACGQTASCAFTVTVAPLMAVCSPNLTARATDPSGATVFYSSSTSGGCTGATVNCSPPSGSTFPIGTTTVSCLATDACGETANCAFTVTVNPPFGWSGTNTVTFLADSGPGSLRQVMADSTAGDAIVFNVTGTITLASGELVVSKDLAIIGPGTSALAISGAGKSRIFNINSNVTALISSLTVANGWAPGNGGGIYNAGTLRLDNLILSGNSTSGGAGGAAGQSGGQGGSGGGIWNGGTCFVNRCSFSSNHTGAGGSGGYAEYSPGSGGGGGDGGGIYNVSQMALTNCTVSNNSCGGGGNGAGSSLFAGFGGSGGRGAGVCSGGSLVLIGCTLVNNRTGSGGNGGGTGTGMPGNGGPGGEGGGISATGPLVLTNCTLWGNSCGNGGVAGSGGMGTRPPGGAGGNGGGICCYAYATQVVVVACTIVANSTGGGGSPGGPSGSGGGVYGWESSGPLYCFLDDIVALNSVTNAGMGPDVYGAFNSLGHNLIGATNDSSGFTASGDLAGSKASPLDPRLAPLADNGGPTLTMALLTGSPAIDAGDTSAAPTTDQRGFPRPGGLAADIGAYELCYPPILLISAPQAGAIRIQAYGTNGQACRLLSSPDLSSWIPRATNQIGSDGTLLFNVNCAPGSACRFYRLVMP